jgi:hypothetical protein
MAGRKKKYTLDDIDFVGMQDKGTPAQVKKDIDRTIQYFKDLKAGKVIPQSRNSGTGIAKCKRRLNKAK